jgi:hypothetical protein
VSDHDDAATTGGDNSFLTQRHAQCGSPEGKDELHLPSARIPHARRPITARGGDHRPTVHLAQRHAQDPAAVATSCPAAKHTRTELHRAGGETTKPIERSHVPTRDRLRSSRRLKTLTTGQRFFEGFEALQALFRGHVHLHDLMPDYNSADATPHARARAVVVAVNALGAAPAPGRATAPLAAFAGGDSRCEHC